MRLLVVEDDDEMRALMERGLAAEGYRVVAVENGVEALIALGEQSFDLAVVDVMMPGMSGFELARRIREREDPVRILLVTARDAVDDRVFGLDAGADDYLTKPFAFAELPPGSVRSAAARPPAHPARSRWATSRSTPRPVASRSRASVWR